MKLPFGLRDITYVLSFSSSPEKKKMGVGDNGNTTRVIFFPLEANFKSYVA